VLPKSGFPFAASIENVLSGVEGEDDFVLEGPAAGAKGARARNMIATPSRPWHRRPKPMKKWAHAEALPIVLARHSIEGMKTMPHPGAHPTARPPTPKYRERRSWRCLPKPMRKRVHARALPIFGIGGFCKRQSGGAGQLQ
jgi:hypothetical protein